MAARIFLSLAMSMLWLLPQQTPPGDRVHPSPAPAPPVITWHATGEITVPFEIFQQHIYVSLSLNGRAGYVFLLDTGANRNILDLRTARELGIESQHASVEQDIGFGNGFIYTAPAVTVHAAIANVPVADTMAVMDLNRFARHFHHVTDGMLGYPFLEKYVVKLDYQDKLLTILPPESFSYGGSGVRVTLKPSNNFVVMPLTIGTSTFVFSKVNVVVDSGSNLTLMLYQRYVPQFQLENSLKYAQPDKGYGLNGFYPMQRGTIDSLRIGFAEARSVPVEFIEKDQELTLARHIPGAIGNGILQSFKDVIFDVPHGRMIFELKPLWQSGVQRTYSAPR